MRKIFYFLLTTVAMTIFAGCQSDNEPEFLPEEITQFMQFYFAGESFTSTATDSGYTITVHDGATIKFNTDNQWTDINGNGVPLNDMLIYNILPNPLYGYTQEMEATDGVYRVTRLMSVYTVYFLDSSVSYDASTDSFIKAN